MATSYPFRDGNSHFNGNQLEPRQQLWIKGEANFTNLAKPLTGEELEQYNRRQAELAARRGGASKPVGDMSLIVQLAQVEVVPPKDAEKEQQNKQLETYIRDHIYVSDQHPELGYQYRRAVKAQYLPTYLFLQADGSYKPMSSGYALQGEPANGTHLRIMFNTYETANGGGLGIKYVMFDDMDVKYFQRGVNPNDFTDLGVSLAAPANDPRILGGANAAPEDADIPDEPDDDGSMASMLA